MDTCFSFSRMLPCSAISTDAVSSPSPADAMKMKVSRKEPGVPAANPQHQAAQLLEHPAQISKSLKVKWMLLLQFS